MNSTKPKIKKTMNTDYEENRIHRTEKKNTNIENINSTNNILELKSNTIEAKALASATTKLKPYENTENYDELSVSYEENNTNSTNSTENITSTINEIQYNANSDLINTIAMAKITTMTI